MDKMEELPPSSAEGPIEIYTLGRFLIGRSGRPLLEGSLRAEKVWSLLQYLITCRGKALFPADILDALWPGHRYSDPNRALRSIVFRLRRLLTDRPALAGLAANIVFARGCYRWIENDAYRLDADEFERIILYAEELKDTYPCTAIDLLKKAKRMYLGDYLPECAAEAWVLSARSYYHQLYLKQMLLLAELLKKEGRFAEITELCGSALEIEYFEEKLHLCYLEALIEEGKWKQARLHYEKATAAFYREMGAKPSEAMRLLYSRIRFDHEESYNLNLSAIQERLRDQESTAGALVCDTEIFQYYFQLEKKRMERSGQRTWLALLALTAPDFCRLPPVKLREAVGQLDLVLRSSLRKGDIICRTHEAQFLLLLPNCNKARSLRILVRIEDEFRRSCTDPGLVLHKKVQPLAASSSLVPFRNSKPS